MSNTNTTDLQARELDEVGREHHGAALGEIPHHLRPLRHQPQPVRVDDC